MKFRKKPVVIDAVQWDGANVDEVLGLCLATGSVLRGAEQHSLIIETLEGNMKASRGDWVVKGVKGEVYPVKPDIFAQTYSTEDGATASEFTLADRQILQNAINHNLGVRLAEAVTHLLDAHDSLSRTNLWQTKQ